MNKDLKNANVISRPDPLAPDHVKKLDSYGVAIAKSIGQEWFAGGMITKGSTFMGRHKWIEKMRLYARGEQDTQPYKDHVSRQEQDLSYLNLDWTPINIPENFTNVLRNGITDENYNLDIRSIDKFSAFDRKNKRMKHLANMAAKPMLEKAKALGMPDLVPKGFIPEDEEELDLYMEIKDRPRQEIAEEIMIDFVKKTNSWDFIHKKCIKDLVECGIMAARVYTDKNNGVMLDYIDVETYGHSYVEREDFKDAYYHFFVETITLNDLKRESGFKDEKLREIAKLYAGHNNVSTYYDFQECNMDSLLDYRIHVMRFCYKSSKEIVFKKYHDKKNNVRKVAKRDSEFTVPEGAEKSRLSKVLDTWYEGNFVVGSQDCIYDYKECENLAKDEMNKVLPPFVVQASEIYKNKLKSFLSNIIPLCNQMQYAHLKIQHLMAELKPDLIELDLDQLADLSTDGKGGSNGKNWETALSILNVKGVVIKKRVNMGEDGIKDGASARPMPTQQGSALAALLNIWAHYYRTIRETTGINPARDGSISEEALVGLNKMMQLASNTATKHIVDAAVYFDKRICGTISSRIKGIFTFKEAKALQKLYTQAVGQQHLDAVHVMKNRHLHEFGFIVELIPAKQELDELREDLSIAIKEGSIDVSEKSEILRIARNNFKQANEYMRFIRNRRIKQKMKENEYNMKIQSQVNAESAQAKAQAEIQTYGNKKEIDLQYQAKLSAITLRELFERQGIEAPVEDKKFDQQVYLESIKNQQVIDLAKYKEDAKDERQKQQSTEQSQLIEQRQKNKPPIDFKKGFDFDEFLSQ